MWINQWSRVWAVNGQVGRVSARRHSIEGFRADRAIAAPIVHGGRGQVGPVEESSCATESRAVGVIFRPVEC